ncbi:hypothetical protein GGF50DRAFT_121306 [Schizophyllum commune]
MGDLVTFKEVTDLIEGTSVDQHLTADDMHALIDKLAPARFDAWLASCQSALVDMLNAADPHRARPATTADLHLATSVINMGCTVYWYPHILQKRPGFSNWSDAATDPDDPQWIVRERAWSAKAVSIAPDRIRLATRLVTLAGLDPMAATIEDVRYARFALVGDHPWKQCFPSGMFFTEAVNFAKKDGDFVFDKDASSSRAMASERTVYGS